MRCDIMNNEILYGVFRVGGSVGDSDSGLVYHFGRDVGKLVKVLKDELEAKDYAKGANKRLSPGDKKYYGIKYMVKEINNKDVQHP